MKWPSIGLDSRHWLALTEKADVIYGWKTWRSRSGHKRTRLLLPCRSRSKFGRVASDREMRVKAPAPPRTVPLNHARVSSNGCREFQEHCHRRSRPGCGGRGQGTAQQAAERVPHHRRDRNRGLLAHRILARSRRSSESGLLDNEISADLRGHRDGRTSRLRRSTRFFRRADTFCSKAPPSSSSKSIALSSIDHMKSLGLRSRSSSASWRQ